LVYSRREEEHEGHPPIVT
jgi:hypothetical protein